MAASTAMPGYGGLLGFLAGPDGATAPTVAEVYALGWSGVSSKAIDVTNFGSSGTANSREFIAGKLIDWGTIAAKLRIPANPAAAGFKNVVFGATIATGPMTSINTWWITFTDAAVDIFKFNGILTDVSVDETTLDESWNASITIKVTGLPIFTSA